MKIYIKIFHQWGTTGTVGPRWSRLVRVNYPISFNGNPTIITQNDGTNANGHGYKRSTTIEKPDSRGFYVGTDDCDVRAVFWIAMGRVQ